jgi:hypothetical protein
MKRFNKNILFTVAAVITSFTAPSFGRTAYESNGTSNWSSSTAGNSGFPFTAVTKGGPNTSTTTNGTVFTPNVLIVLPGHTLTLTNDITGIDTIYIYGTINMGSNGSDIELTNSNSGTRRGVVRVMNGGLITGGNGSSRFSWAGTAAANINGPYNVTGIKQAVYNTLSASPGARFIAFTPTFEILPVDLASFNVMTTEEGHLASWIATGESNRNSFILESSTNGQDFEFETEVQGTAEMFEQHYSFQISKKNKSFFLRISERNSIGEIIVLATIKVSVASNETATSSVFPTVMNQGSIDNLNIFTPEAGDYSIQISSLNYQVMYNSNISTETENQLTTINLSALNLTHGTYAVSIISANGTRQTEKIIITE